MVTNMVLVELVFSVPGFYLADLAIVRPDPRVRAGGRAIS